MMTYKWIIKIDLCLNGHRSQPVEKVQQKLGFYVCKR